MGDRCRNGEFTVQACPSHDVVGAYEFSDRHGDRLVINRGMWDGVSYLGRGQWLVFGLRDVAVAAVGVSAPQRLRLRPDLLVEPETGMIPTVCPAALWGAIGPGRRDESTVCLVDESTWQLIPMRTPPMDRWQESPSTTLWGTCTSPTSGAAQAVVRQDDGTYVATELGPAGTAIAPVDNLPSGLLAVFRVHWRTTPEGGLEATDLAISTDGGLTWSARTVPTDVAVLAATGGEPSLVLPAGWESWTGTAEPARLGVPVTG